MHISRESTAPEFGGPTKHNSILSDRVPISQPSTSFRLAIGPVIFTSELLQISSIMSAPRNLRIGVDVGG